MHTQFGELHRNGMTYALLDDVFACAISLMRQSSGVLLTASGGCNLQFRLEFRFHSKYLKI